MPEFADVVAEGAAASVASVDEAAVDEEEEDDDMLAVSPSTRKQSQQRGCRVLDEAQDATLMLIPAYGDLKRSNLGRQAQMHLVRQSKSRCNEHFGARVLRPPCIPSIATELSDGAPTT